MALLAERDAWHGHYRKAIKGRGNQAAKPGQRGDDKLSQFMVRVRIPGGRLIAAQYLALDELADRYANGSLRITTRQSIQFHGVVKPGLKRTIAEINRALLTTLAASGDAVRTVTTVPAPQHDTRKRDALFDDCGVVLNPLLAEGQIQGGIVQGIGQVLMENIVYDESGQLLSGSFQDYCMPRADDFCHFDLGNNESPTDRNPLGVKGVGEAGTLGAIPAVMNAVNDALARIGAPAVEMPTTSEKVWRAICAADGNGRSA
jgi:hypothetical protein